MASMEGIHLISLLIFVLASSVACKKTYIVQMKANAKPSVFLTRDNWYLSSLHSAVDNVNTVGILYSYSNAYNGFAVSLEPEQVEALKQQGSVLNVYEDGVCKLHTTRTPQLLKVDDEFGLWGQNIGNGSGNGKFPEVIIGFLDSGVHPESKSFNDDGFPEIPMRWKGVCVNGPDFDPAKHCNKKLIGARYFVEGYLASPEGQNMTDGITPRDHNGHGTHTASTAAGSPVPNANFFGYANGTARGMAPHARIASYKVCWGDNCMNSDILAAIDQAIKDGVDVLSLSIGGNDGPYYSAPIATGSFAAMEKGIFVSASAGNSGPNFATLSNGAPWIMTVGSATLDRDFPAYVTLGNKQRFKGRSISRTNINGQQFPLIYAKETNESRLCLNTTLDPRVVKGKVVICDRGYVKNVEKSMIVLQAGAAGMILCNTEQYGEKVDMSPSAFMLPALHVGSKDGDLIKKYAMLDPNPTATLLFGPEEFPVRPSPVVAKTSSRGPYLFSPQILKPDVVAPGVAILASWNAINPSVNWFDTRMTDFNIISGTSMSCPHVSGIAALLKIAHPEWSTSAIKSALMTTAYVNDNTRLPIREEMGGPANPWSLGAGHINPRKALSPGLIYDITPQDYTKFICSLNYTIQQVGEIARNTNITCSDKFADPGELNYPSFSVLFSEDKKVVQYNRELTNVGSPGSVYRVSIKAPPSVSVEVQPRRLVFKTVGEKARYQVTFISRMNQTKYGDGSITWMNRQHQVRSPVTFFWQSMANTL